MHLSKISLALRQWGNVDPDAAIKALFANNEQGAWYDPSDLTTMFQDSAGTTPVTADGQPVGKILDKSGRGNHASQATAAWRPLYKTDGTYHWLQFDGVDDSLSTAAINFSSTDKMSVFYGVKKLDDTARMVAELSEGSLDGSFYCLTGIDSGFIAYSSSAKGTQLANGNQTAGLQIVSGIDTAVITATHDISGDISKIRRNAVDGTNGTGEKGSGNFGTYHLYVGSRSGGVLFFNSNLYSLIVLGRLSTTQEITDTETWVAAKTGVTLP